MNRLSESDIIAMSRLTGVSITEIRRGLAAGFTPVLTPRSTSRGGVACAQERQQNQHQEQEQ